VFDMVVCMLVVVMLCIGVVIMVVVMFLKCVVTSFDSLWYSICVCARVVDVRRCS
jgi:hypothetical protein